jgi:RNA polymerase sigma-70 factor (ECF subfamily)
VANRDAIAVALGRLSATHRTILVLREFAELDYEEIAEELSIPVGTVRSRLARARSELARMSAESGAFDDPAPHKTSSSLGTVE